MSIISKKNEITALEWNRRELTNHPDLLNPQARSHVYEKFQSILSLVDKAHKDPMSVDDSLKLLQKIEKLADKCLTPKIIAADSAPHFSPLLASLHLDAPVLRNKTPLFSNDDKLLRDYDELTIPNTKLGYCALVTRSEKFLNPSVYHQHNNDQKLLETIEKLAHMRLGPPIIDALHLDPPLLPKISESLTPIKEIHPTSKSYDELVTPDSYLGCRALNITLIALQKKHLDPSVRFKQALNFIKIPLELFTQPQSAQLLENRSVQLPSETSKFMRYVFKSGLPTFKPFRSGGCAKLDSTTLKGLESDQCYVIKKLKTSYTKTELRSLINEVLISATLRHPHILPTHAVSVNGLYFPHGLCFVKQILEAPLCDHTTSPPAIKKYFIQIAQALAFIHEQGFTHKDVKADNIILLEDMTAENTTYNAYLIDFGLSCKTIKDTHKSGTPEYFAPEMLIDDGDEEPPIFPAKIDVWAFGLLIFESIFGCSIGMIPKQESHRQTNYDTRSFLRKHFKKPLPNDFFDHYYANERCNTNLQHRDPFGFFRSIATKCLHGDPNKRPSMEEVTSMLEQAYTQFSASHL